MVPVAPGASDRLGVPTRLNPAMAGLIEQPLTLRLFEFAPAVLVIEIVRLAVLPTPLTPNVIGPAVGDALI